jgi:flagellar biosynthesis anti-sigma factor FlgM
MRIDVTTSGLQPTENSGSQKTGQRGNAAAGTRDMTRDNTQAGSAGDSAQFSFDQTRIQSLSAQALSEPGVRQATVALLAQAISTGEYTVDPTKVAGALISAYSGEPLSSR